MAFLGSAFGESLSYLNRHAEGWHWYEELPQGTQEKEAPQALPEASPSPNASPLKTLQAFKQKVEELKAIAVMTPTFANVKAYMEIQKALMDRASRFSTIWQKVVYLTPALDYTLKHPVSQVGRHVYLDEQRRALEENIRTLSQTHGLFFFFSNSCVYCREFAPIVKSFASKYGWQVLAISMDGSKLPEFPDAQNDNGASTALGVKALPALIAADPQTGQTVPLSYGMTTHDQIEDRIRVLILKRTP